MPRIVILLLLVTACGPRDRARPGELDAVWRGEESGRFIAPLSAIHCAETGIVELLAIRGDTGVGAALFLQDSARVDPVEFQVVPGSLYNEPRPGATAGIRWFATTTISAFEGVAGMIRLELTGEALTGSMDVKFQSVDRPDTLRMAGTFDRVPLVRADSGCGLISKRNRV